MSPIKISVVIPTYSRKNLLKGCLGALFSQTYPKQLFEILVVDDGSSDSTASLVKTLQAKNPNLVYLRQDHGGVAKARNLGVKKATGEIIAFTDDDCLAKKDWLEKLAETFRQHPKALGIEGKTLTYPGKTTPFTAQIVNIKGGSYQTCNIAYRKKILKKIGGLDENFTLLHADDVDLALRVLKYGPIFFAPEAVVFHLPRETSFKREFLRVNNVIPEIYLFLKHPDYFQKKYGQKNVFFQVVFVNFIWIRLFHLKFNLVWLIKNPYFYGKFLIRTLAEIILILLFIPKFYVLYKKFQTEFSR